MSQFAGYLVDAVLPALGVELERTFTHQRYGYTLPTGKPRPLTEEEHAERARQEWLLTQPIQGCEANPLRILQARAERAGVSNPLCDNCGLERLDSVDSCESAAYDFVCFDWTAKA